MKQVHSLFKESCNSDVIQSQCKIEVCRKTKTDPIVTLDSSDFIEQTLTITGKTSSSSSFTVGGVCATKMTVTLTRSGVSKLKQHGVFKKNICWRVKQYNKVADQEQSETDFSKYVNGNDYEKGMCRLGVFYVSNIGNNDYTCEITAYDGMLAFEKSINGSELLYMQSHLGTIGDWAVRFEDKCKGDAYDFSIWVDTSLANVYLQTKVSEDVKVETFREALGYLTSYVGGFATFDEFGDLQIRSFEYEPVEIDMTHKMLLSGRFDSVVSAITGFYSSVAGFDYSSKGNVVGDYNSIDMYLSENPFLRGIQPFNEKTMHQSVLTALTNLSSYLVTKKFFGCDCEITAIPYVNLGDCLAIQRLVVNESGEATNVVETNIIVCEYTYNFGSKITIKSNGATTSSTSAGKVGSQPKLRDEDPRVTDLIDSFTKVTYEQVIEQIPIVYDRTKPSVGNYSVFVSQYADVAVGNELSFSAPTGVYPSRDEEDKFWYVASYIEKEEDDEEEEDEDKPLPYKYGKQEGNIIRLYDEGNDEEFGKYVKAGNTEISLNTCYYVLKLPTFECDFGQVSRDYDTDNLLSMFDFTGSVGDISSYIPYGNDEVSDISLTADFSNSLRSSAVFATNPFTLNGWLTPHYYKGYGTIWMNSAYNIVTGVPIDSSSGLAEYDVNGKSFIYNTNNRDMYEEYEYHGGYKLTNFSPTFKYSLKSSVSENMPLGRLLSLEYSTLDELSNAIKDLKFTMRGGNDSTTEGHGYFDIAHIKDNGLTDGHSYDTYRRDWDCSLADSLQEFTEHDIGTYGNIFNRTTEMPIPTVAVFYSNMPKFVTLTYTVRHENEPTIDDVIQELKGIDELREEVANLTELSTLVGTEVVDIKTDIEALKAKDVELEGRIADLEEQGLEVDLTEVNEAISSLQTTTTDLSVRTVALEMKSLELESGVSALEVSKAEKSALNSLADRVTELEENGGGSGGGSSADLTELENRVTSLEQNKADKSQITQINASLASLQEQLTSLSADMVVVKASVNQIPSILQSIEDLNNRVTILETGVAPEPSTFVITDMWLEDADGYKFDSRYKVGDLLYAPINTNVYICISVSKPNSINAFFQMGSSDWISIGETTQENKSTVTKTIPAAGMRFKATATLGDEVTSLEINTKGYTKKISVSKTQSSFDSESATVVLVASGGSPSVGISTYKYKYWVATSSTVSTRVGELTDWVDDATITVTKGSDEVGSRTNFYIQYEVTDGYSTESGYYKCY